MKKKANALKYINPFYTALKANPTSDDMWKNLLGVSLATAPPVALLAWLANKTKMKEMREAIDKNAETNVNSTMPVLQPDDIKGNIDERNKRELTEVSKQLAKQAAGDNPTGDILHGWGKEILYGTLPILAPAAITWLVAKGTNKVLKDEYASELDAENKKIQDLQDKVDMATLERLGYIKKRQQPRSLEKQANLSDDIFSALATVGKFLSGGVDTVKKGMITLPGVALLTAGAGLGTWGAAHFLKKHDDNQKLELLKKRMLGKDQILDSPTLSVDIPEGYEETGKKTSQLLPGISPALIPQQAIEDAIVVEKPKKDAFLG